MARSTLTLTIAGEQASPTPYVDQVRHVAKSVNLAILPGLLDNQFNKLYVQSATIASGANVDVNLSTALDRFGVALALSDVALVWIENTSSVAAVLTVKAGAANGFTNLLATSADVKLSAGDFLLVGALTAGNLAVTGTNAVLNLGATVADVDVVVHVWGRG
tara:strand:- start:43 stop:528 length:486 start_codon:yes stop_codon:yes gene_type:complete